MKSIYFFDGKGIRKHCSFGQLIDIGISCYIRGKELGYDKIFVEWHDINSFLWTDEGTFLGNIKCPQNRVLPISFVDKGTKVDADKSIDISEWNSLYDGCPPLISSEMISAVPSCNYLNKYYHEHNLSPFIELEKNQVEPYILFHYRKSPQNRQKNRNLPDYIYLDIINILKEKFGTEFKYYKIGEKGPLDELCDKFFRYYPEDIDRLFEIIRDSFLYVGTPSGPHSFTRLIHHPLYMIVPDSNPNDISFEAGWKHSEELFKRRYYKDFKCIGFTGYDYIDEATQKYIKEKDYNSKDLINFIKLL